MYKRRALIVAAVAASLGVAGIVPLTAGAAQAGSLNPARAGTIIKSENGGPVGYAAIPKKGGSAAFRYVAATFTLPRTYCSNDGGGSLTNFLVGLGASSTSTDTVAAGAEEAGVYTSCDSSEHNTYLAGYCQAVTRNGCYQPQDTFAVSPGDSIFASVFYDRFTKQYSYEVHDLDTGQKLSVTRSCPSGCSVDSAAVTADDPSGGPYSTFSEVQFAASARHRFHRRPRRTDEQPLEHAGSRFRLA